MRGHLGICCLLAALTLVQGCWRSGFDASLPDKESDAAPPADTIYLDARSADSTADSSASRQLICEKVQLVGSDQESNIDEPAIMPHGLILVARVVGADPLYSSERLSLDAPFGPWSAFADPWPSSSKGDLTFFEDADGLHAIAATQGIASRTLQHCQPDGSCEAITLYDEVNGVSLDGLLDLDGPSLAAATREMLVNVASSTSLSAIYRATPRDATLLEWDAEPLLFSPPDAILDDAAITADGSLVVMVARNTTSPLPRYAFRLAGGTYGPLQQLDIDLEDCDAIEVFLRPDGSYEIFLGGSRDTVAGLYAARCR